MGASVRHQVDSAAVAGTSLRDIARQHDGLSKDSVRRHLMAHMAPEVQAVFTEGQTVDAASLALQVLEIAEDLKEASEEAKAKGNGRDVARLADSRLRAWALLSNRLGIDEPAVSLHLDRAIAVFHALRAVTREHPEIREPLIKSLRAQEPRDGVLSRVIEELETKELEQ